jgi:predicted DNA-binding transcriptional regulator YafY
MNFRDQIRRLERLDYLFRSRSTGTPAELAKKLSLSKSQVYQIIKNMKQDLGAPIYYSRTHQSYIYKGNKRFVCYFSDDNSPEQ